VAAVIVVAAAWIFMNSASEDLSEGSQSAEQRELASSAQEDARDPGSADGGPRIVLPEDTHDFGEIMQGESISHTFVVRNAGDEPLRLIEAKAG
jgi:hypothetical protein